MLQECRPPAPALTEGGRWKRGMRQEATHLPIRAGYNWVRTAEAGLLLPVTPVAFFYANHTKTLLIFCDFSPYFSKPLETKKNIVIINDYKTRKGY